MKKLKATGFAAMYLGITIALQFVVMFYLMFHMLMLRMPMNQILDFFAGLETNYRDNLMLVSVLNLVYIAGFGTWYFFIRKKTGGTLLSYRRILSPGSIVCMAGLAVCAQLCCNLLMLLVHLMMPEQFNQYTKLMEGLDIQVMPAWAMILIVAIWAPLAEELIFRAMIYRTLRKGFGVAVAAVLSGVIFGVYHMNVVQGIYAGALGILLAYIYETTDSLLGSYLYHMLFNLSSYVLEGVQKWIPVPETVLGMLLLLLSFGAIPGMIFLIRIFRKIYRIKPVSYMPENGRRTEWNSEREAEDENI